MKLCKIEGCGRRHHGNGYCKGHHERWRNGVRGKKLRAPLRAYGLPCEHGITPKRNCTPCNSTEILARRDPVAHRATNKVWKQRNPDKVLALRLRQHGLTIEQFFSLLDSQGGGCADCGSTESGNLKSSRLEIDHDHDCCPGTYSCGDCVRGLVCRPCNLRRAKADAA